MKFTWLVAHKPERLFIRTAQAFEAALNDLAPGRFEVEILTMKEYCEKTGQELTFLNASKIVKNGECDIVQTYTTYLATIDNLWNIVDLPYLFQDHDHVSHVFEGAVGKTLLNCLERDSNLHGLGYTYSGGFRLIGSKEPLTSLSQIAGQEIRCTSNPIIAKTYEALGAKLNHGIGEEFIDYEFDNTHFTTDLSDTTYQRLVSVKKHILDTRHSLFLTAIVMNKELFSNLSDEDKELVEEASLRASRVEREISIREYYEFIESCDDNNIIYTDISDEDAAKFKKLCEEEVDFDLSDRQQMLVDSIKKVS